MTAQKTSQQNRREFIGQCAVVSGTVGKTVGASTISFAALDAVAQTGRPQAFARVRLLSEDGKPLLSKALKPRFNYVFHYPFESTPAFLIHLGKPTVANAQLRTQQGQDYQWQGGVGPTRSVVAYAAICSHQMAYPTRELSAISFRDQASAVNPLAQVIHCCAEHSQYDPAQGAKVMSGPAPQPLAAILLEHNARSDELFAVGVQGGQMYEQFFARYAVKLQMELGDRAKTLVHSSAVVKPLENFCRQQIKC